MCLLVRLGLLAQIFEPSSKVLVHELTRADSVVALANDQVRKSAVEFDGLRNLGQLHQFREVVYLCADGKVVVCELMRPSLSILAASGYVATDLVVLLLEGGHLVAELGGFPSTLDLDLSCDRLELVDVARTNLVFDAEQLEIELLLIVLLQEGHKELAGLEDLRAQNCIQEPLIVLLSLNELPWRLALGLNTG